MAQKPIAMEQLKQILQLHADGTPIREIARRVGISRNSVRKYLFQISSKDSLSEVELAEQAYHNDIIAVDAERLRQLTVYLSQAGSELSRTGVTRKLLWQEYLSSHPDGYSYSRYCYHLEQFLKNKDVTMHLEYQAADMIMIDFAGKKLHYVDLSTGEKIDCQIFVAILPYSGLIFCYAVHSQKSEDFVECINAMLLFFKGVPATILADNMKTAVVRPSKYEPGFTDLCYQLSEHYNTTFSATRPYSPRDKAMVEGAVKIVYAHVYAPLRNEVFTSIDKLNAALRQQLVLLNNKPYKNTPYSRWYYYEQSEQGLLKPLPVEKFAPKKVTTLTVQRNYHIQLREDGHYFSVPYTCVGKKVKVLYDSRTVEVYDGYNRIALHIRKPQGSAYTTLGEHMPPNHQRMKQIKGFNQEDLLGKARRIGTAALAAAERMLQNSIYMEQNYKACFGMLMLEKKYNATRLEAACQRAIQGSRINYTMIKTILEKGLDKQLSLIGENNIIPEHENIRGKDHYQ